jgi:hypothetical protein
VVPPAVKGIEEKKYDCEEKTIAVFVFKNW